jgi:hypothetical protein
LWIFENVAELVALASQHLGGQLRGNLHTGDGLIFRYKPDLIDFYAGVSSQSGLQLFGESASLGATGGERPYKARELCLSGVWCEMDACDPRRGQELCEASLSRCRAQWDSV